MKHIVALLLTLSLCSTASSLCMEEDDTVHNINVKSRQKHKIPTIEKTIVRDLLEPKVGRIINSAPVMGIGSEIVGGVKKIPKSLADKALFWLPSSATVIGNNILQRSTALAGSTVNYVVHGLTGLSIPYISDGFSIPWVSQAALGALEYSVVSNIQPVEEEPYIDEQTAFDEQQKNQKDAIYAELKKETANLDDEEDELQKAVALSINEHLPTKVVPTRKDISLNSGFKAALTDIETWGSKRADLLSTREMSLRTLNEKINRSFPMPNNLRSACEILNNIATEVPTDTNFEKLYELSANSRLNNGRALQEEETALFIPEEGGDIERVAIGVGKYTHAASTCFATAVDIFIRESAIPSESPFVMTHDSAIFSSHWHSITRNCKRLRPITPLSDFLKKKLVDTLLADVEYIDNFIAFIKTNFTDNYRIQEFLYGVRGTEQYVGLYTTLEGVKNVIRTELQGKPIAEFKRIIKEGIIPTLSALPHTVYDLSDTSLYRVGSSRPIFYSLGRDCYYAQQDGDNFDEPLQNFIGHLILAFKNISDDNKRSRFEFAIDTRAALPPLAPPPPALKVTEPVQAPTITDGIKNVIKNSAYKGASIVYNLVEKTRLGAELIEAFRPEAPAPDPTIQQDIDYIRNMNTEWNQVNEGEETKWLPADNNKFCQDLEQGVTKQTLSHWEKVARYKGRQNDAAQNRIMGPLDRIQAAEAAKPALLAELKAERPAIYSNTPGVSKHDILTGRISSTALSNIRSTLRKSEVEEIELSYIQKIRAFIAQGRDKYTEITVRLGYSVEIATTALLAYMFATGYHAGSYYQVHQLKRLRDEATDAFDQLIEQDRSVCLPAFDPGLFNRLTSEELSTLQEQTDSLCKLLTIAQKEAAAIDSTYKATIVDNPYVVEAYNALQLYKSTIDRNIQHINDARNTKDIWIDHTVSCIQNSAALFIGEPTESVES